RQRQPSPGRRSAGAGASAARRRSVRKVVMRPKVAVSVSPKPPPLRVGIDLGGTKIEGVVMDEAGTERPRLRVATPRDDYAATVEAITSLVDGLLTEAEAAAGAQCTIGVATPGSISPSSGRIQNANSTWLNGRTLGPDLTARL